MNKEWAEMSVTNGPMSDVAPVVVSIRRSCEVVCAILTGDKDESTAPVFGFDQVA